MGGPSQDGITFVHFCKFCYHLKRIIEFFFKYKGFEAPVKKFLNRRFKCLERQFLQRLYT